MSPALIKSLLSTMGVNPDVIVKHVETIAQIAQSIDMRLASIEARVTATEIRVAEIHAMLSETDDGNMDVKVLEFIETGKGKRK